MKTAIITRTETGVDGTFGIFKAGAGFEVYTCERPWQNNKTDFSCIPAGIYLCQKKVSPHFGSVYHIMDVPKREHILIHPANWAYQLKGCIALGRSITIMTGIKAITSSKDALKSMEAEMDKEPFTLTIIGLPEMHI